MNPPYRHLRGYAFDPSASLDLDTSDVNNIVYKIRWETRADPKSKQQVEGAFGLGPVGEYIEVVDYDPTCKKWYEPVDLDDQHILATDGLAPSESNPQFHQQMVYAVAMLTIQNFEKALGRKIHWSPRLLSGKKYEEYVPRLRIYPHALRAANAYYSPQKKALLFGYFAATPAKVSSAMPGSLVFTCLSHDIIAHEVTHAILDGLHRNYNRATNPDVLAFHEAFSDIVALFQHFTFPEVLKHQIAQTRGDLEKQNLLGKLAQQFGTAIGQYGSLRDALGKIDKETNEWIPAEPNPSDYLTVTQPHERGSILVGAVFDAFMSVYKRRIRDLLRIATSGTGILPEGDIHPDLVNRLANEASKTAQDVLTMCIRALDYCPPVDITFGDYLRAIITGDCDLVDDDKYKYRLAFIHAFRCRGIYPRGIKTLSEQSLCHRDLTERLDGPLRDAVNVLVELLHDFRASLVSGEKDQPLGRKELYEVTRRFIAGHSGAKGFHSYLISNLHRVDDYDELAWEFGRLSGLILQHWESYGVRSSGKPPYERPSFQVLDLHVVSRVGPDGDQVNQIVFGLVQRMGVRPQPDGTYEFKPPKPSNVTNQTPEEGFEIQGGCTLVFDLNTFSLKYAIAKPLLDPVRNHDNGTPMINVDRIRSQHEFLQDTMSFNMNAVAQHFGAGVDTYFGEPFALLHSKGDS